MNDRALVNLRCSAVVFRADAVLLCQRSSGEWVLPGGTPQHGEGSAACVLREVREETGLLVDPWRVAFVLEATNLDHGQHLIEIVFHAVPVDPGADPVAGEAGLAPRYLPVAELARAGLRPRSRTRGPCASRCRPAERVGRYTPGDPTGAPNSQDTGPTCSLADDDAGDSTING